LRPLGFDFPGLFLDEPDEMVHDIGVLNAVMRQAGHIDHVRALAAAGDADIRFARLARAVDDAADD